jgi:hypothetical protein
MAWKLGLMRAVSPCAFIVAALHPSFEVLKKEILF